MNQEREPEPEAEKYQELTEDEFNTAAEFFIKNEDGTYSEKVTKTNDHTYETGKYFKEKEQEQQSSTGAGAGPAASEVTEGSATPAVTGGVLSQGQIDAAKELAETIVRDPKFIAAATSAAAGPGQTEVNGVAADGAGAKVNGADGAANSGGRRRTKRKQQKKGKSAKKGGKKHRKSSGNKSRRNSSKKSRRQGRK